MIVPPRVLPWERGSLDVDDGVGLLAPGGTIVVGGGRAIEPRYRVAQRWLHHPELATRVGTAVEGGVVVALRREPARQGIPEPCR